MSQKGPLCIDTQVVGIFVWSPKFAKRGSFELQAFVALLSTVVFAETVCKISFAHVSNYPDCSNANDCSKHIECSDPPQVISQNKKFPRRGGKIYVCC